MALEGCTEPIGYRRGALLSFLSALSDEELMAMRIKDSASNDEIAGFLDREEMRSGDMISCLLWCHMNKTDDSHPLLDFPGL